MTINKTAEQDIIELRKAVGELKIELHQLRQQQAVWDAMMKRHDAHPDKEFLNDRIKFIQSMGK